MSIKRFFLSVTICAFFISSGVDALAQFSPDIEVTSTALTPTVAITMDLDGDLDLDVISASYSDGKIAWYENLGSGFSRQWIIAEVTGGLEAMVLEDIDGDSDLDIVVTISNLGSRAVWFENLGNLNWGDEQFIGIANDPNSLDVIDLDNDGDLDVLISAYGGSNASWFQNDGIGNFGPSQIISGTASQVKDAKTGDIDNDGDLDVVVASYGSDMIALYENLGGGVFGTEQILGSGSNFNQANSVEVVDINNDGLLDIVCSAYIQDVVMWFENLGGGTFGTEQIISSSVTQVTHVTSEDLDNDGDQDLCAIGYSGLYFFENLGAGSFGAPIISTLGSYLESVSFADIDSDGYKDALISDYHIVYWLKGQVGFSLGARQDVSNNVYDIRDIKTADLNNDGLEDVIAVCGQYNDRIMWFENYGNDIYSAKRIIATTLSTTKALTTLDFDNDGDEDIVVSGENEVVMFENVGGTFLNEQIISNNPSMDFHVADIQNDGWDDIVCVLTNEVYVLVNNGGTTIFPISINPISGGVQNISCSDFDNDGDIDIVSAVNGNTDHVFWHENTGGLNFNAPAEITVISDNIQKVSTFDVDMDLDDDIVLISRNDHILEWCENLGNGNFASGQQLAAPFGPYDLEFEDINVDGKIDIVCSLIDGDKIIWYENQGSGLFAAEQTLLVVNTPGHMELADMDNDLDMDILTLPLYSYGLYVNQNGFYSETQIRGELYADLNQNQQRDSTEIGLPQIAIQSVPLSDFSYTYPDGEYLINFTDTMGVYIVAPVVPQYWAISTDSLSYTVVIDSVFTNMDSLDFGFYPDTIVDDLEPVLVGGFPRCSTVANYYVNVQNIGTTTPSGYIELMLDDSLTFVNSSLAPDSIVGQHHYWAFDSLEYFGVEQFTVEVQMPDVNGINDTIESYLSLFIDSSGVFLNNDADTLQQRVVCAYDPNDKVSEPSGFGPEGYIDTTIHKLEYTIRFQNTGNDTAVVVRILDQLSPYLKWNTLNIKASSHTMQTAISGLGEVEFLFDDIYLPDSNVNYLGSQGYVTYEIEIGDVILMGVPIQNTANIYFDYNTAIITNTTNNTYYNCDGIFENFELDDTIEVCQGDSFFFDTYINGIDYSWQSSDGTLQNGASFIWPSDSAGFYSVQVVGQNQLCYAEANVDIFVDPCLGLVEQQKEDWIQFSPNPTSDALSISIDEAGSFNLTVQNQFCQTVFEQECFGDTSVSIAHLASGLYYITFIKGSRRVTRKLIKQ